MPATDPDNPAAPCGAVIPDGLVRPDERVILAIKPSGLFVPLISVPFWIYLAAILAAAWALDYAGLVKLPMHWLFLAALAAGLLRLIVAFLQWLARTYVLTDQRVVRAKGVLWVRIFECGLSRVQNTDLSMPLVQRMLGVGTLYFSTAGTAGRDAAWLIIAKPAHVHQTVTEWIRRAQSTAGPTVP